MASAQLTQVVQQLRRLTAPGDVPCLSDGALLTRFFEVNDEAAFEELVRRYGSLVLGVCQRMLRNLHDTEDAFQAVFLVLVRKGRGLLGREQIGNWLYGVAYHTALKARAAAVQRRSKESRVDAKESMPPADEDLWRDWLPVLDRELNRLPDKYREAVVACDLLGKSRHDAARQLGIPEGTLSSRLAMARRKLAERLKRQGAALSGGAVAAGLGHSAASAHVPASLMNVTIKGAALCASGQTAATGLLSPKVVALSERVLKAMLISRLKSAALGIVAILMLALGGAVVVSGNTEGASDGDKPANKAPTDEDRELARLQGTWCKATLEIDGRPNALFANVEPFYNFQGNRFTVTDYNGVVHRKGTVKILPGENAIDLIVNEGQAKDTTLLLRYELKDDVLRLASDVTKNRPNAMKTTPGSGILIFTFRREKPPRGDDKQNAAKQPALPDAELQKLHGTWNVVAHDTLGKPASAQFLALKHQWIFAGNKVTMRDKEAVGREGTFHINPSTNLKRLDLIMKPGLPPGPRAAAPQEEVLLCIYLLKDDRLTVCYGYPGAERAKEFASKFESKTGLVILQRDGPAERNELEEKKKDKEVPSASIDGLWWLDGNRFTGELVIQSDKGNKLSGSMYTDTLTGDYDAATKVVTINRTVLDRLDYKTVQIYSGSLIADAGSTPSNYLKGTFKSVGGPTNWGAPGVEYPWKAVRYKDYIATVTLNRIMIFAHLTPQNRGTKNNLDNKLMDGKATKIEQQQLLDLYQEIARRKPPKGDVEAWKARTSEMVAATKAVIAGEEQAAARLLKARDCKACHDLHKAHYVGADKRPTGPQFLDPP